MKNKLGVMQGRLSPAQGGKIQSFPLESWSREFRKANQCGVDLVEWIFEEADWEKNPLMSDPGIAQMRDRSAEHNVGILSVCADYFMDRPLLRVNPREKLDRIAMLHKVIAQCAKAQIRYLVIPYVDNSAIASPAEIEEVARDMMDCAPLARENGVTLCLETSLGPREFRKLLDEASDPHVKVNYDIGNSASLGYNVMEEFQSYGRRIATVHIKDRKRAGGTVPLGRGDADFAAVFAQCAAMKFLGPFVLQAARRGDEMETIKDYVRFVRSWIDPS